MTAVAPLASLISLSKDGEWGKTHHFQASREMAVIRGTDFESVRIGDLTGLPIRFIPERAAELKELRDGDILIETAGGSKDRPTGRTLFLRPGLLAGAGMPATPASFSRFIRINSELADPEYVFWYLQFLYQRGDLLAFHTQHTGVARFQWTTCSRATPIPLPPPAHQHRIASILSAYDELIENNTRRIRILEEMAQAIYREWFVEFRFPGHEGVRMVDSELGPIPEGWRVLPLAKLVTTQYGYTESATSTPLGPHFLRGMDINKASYIDWSRVPYCPINDDEHAKFRLEQGDIVVIRMADPGKVGIVETEVDAVFASYLVRLRPREGASVTPYYLFYTLLSEAYQAFARGAATGTTRGSLSAVAMTSFVAAVPTATTQREFDELVGPMRALINSLLWQNANLRATRDLLLPRLTSGEIDVSQLDIGSSEPAA